jgi:arsenate reductase
LAKSVEFYFYANCSSCKKADAILRGEQVDVSRRDIFKRKLSESEIRDLLRRTGLTPRDVLSTRSRPHHDLRLGERVVPDEELIGLMAEHPALLRRPLLVVDGKPLIGFNQAAYEEVASELGRKP